MEKEFTITNTRGNIPMRKCTGTTKEPKGTIMTKITKVTKSINTNTIRNTKRIRP
jgi:hypothetical protein